MAAVIAAGTRISSKPRRTAIFRARGPSSFVTFTGGPPEASGLRFPGTSRLAGNADHPDCDQVVAAFRPSSRVALIRSEFADQRVGRRE
jgi:hypothetical protein